MLQVLLSVTISNATPIDSASRAEANTFFQNQDWKNAAARYKMITKEEANNGQAWFRLGVSLHGLSEHKEAVQSYNNAVRLGFQTINATLRLARTYAVLGQKKKQLLDALQKVVQNVDDGVRWAIYEKEVVYQYGCQPTFQYDVEIFLLFL